MVTVTSGVFGSPDPAEGVQLRQQAQAHLHRRGYSQHLPCGEARKPQSLGRFPLLPERASQGSARYRPSAPPPLEATAAGGTSGLCGSSRCPPPSARPVRGRTPRQPPLFPAASKAGCERRFPAPGRLSSRRAVTVAVCPTTLDTSQAARFSSSAGGCLTYVHM